MAKSSGGSTFVVANYSPPGNYPGKENFQANVLPADPDAGNSEVCTQKTPTTASENTGSSTESW